MLAIKFLRRAGEIRWKSTFWERTILERESYRLKREKNHRVCYYLFISSSPMESWKTPYGSLCLARQGGTEGNQTPKLHWAIQLLVFSHRIGKSSPMEYTKRKSQKIPLSAGHLHLLLVVLIVVFFKRIHSESTVATHTCEGKTVVQLSQGNSSDKSI